TALSPNARPRARGFRAWGQSNGAVPLQRRPFPPPEARSPRTRAAGHALAPVSPPPRYAARADFRRLPSAPPKGASPPPSGRRYDTPHPGGSNERHVDVGALVVTR